MSRAPAHAGRLRPSEQFVFAAVFALMATFVVVITMSAARSPLPLLGGGTTAAGSQTFPAGAGGTVYQPPALANSETRIMPASPRLNARLAAAMTTVLGVHPGQLAVGVIDETTGQQAVFRPAEHFMSGGIVTADILAALLERRNQPSMLVTREQATMASEMIDSSGTAATSMWRAIGGGNGLASANRLLKLNHTIPGVQDRWDQTTTTVADQLQLLIDLTSARSPLAGPARAYVLGLMTAHGTPPRWGVAAAGPVAAVVGGRLPDGQAWVTNSVGIVRRSGHVLLVVVLSTSTSSPEAGISLASAAAATAAGIMTRSGS